MTTTPPLKPNTANGIAIEACRFTLQSSGEIQLTPSGSFSARDGRPYLAKTWRLTSMTAPTVLAALKARQDSIVIDYEHQTLNAEKNGKAAPAAGWFKGSDVVYREGEGLFVVPEWTAAAKAHIDADEYKYFSPVMKYNELTGEILDIVMGALVNHAAIDGMKEVELLAAAKYLSPSYPSQSSTQPQPHQQENPMDEKIKALLGLKADASDDDCLVALKAVLAKNDNAEVSIAAAKAETHDDALQAMSAVQTELAALKSQVNESVVADLVESGLQDGRLVEGQKDWATKLGNSNPDSLKSYMNSTTAVAALKGTQTNGQPPADSSQPFASAEAIEACKLTGVSMDNFIKTQEAQS